MARKSRELENWYRPVMLPVCPLCERPVPESQQDKHHLVPKSKGGKHTEVMHRMCHRQIHALFTEQELATRYSTAEALLEHADIQRFVQWIRKKPDDFYESVRSSARKR